MTRAEREVAEEMKRQGINYGRVWTDSHGVVHGRSSWGGVFDSGIHYDSRRDSRPWSGQYHGSMR